MTDFFNLSVHLDSTHFSLIGKKGAFANAVQRVVAEGYYRGVELPVIEDFDERRRICELLTPAGFRAVMWFAGKMNDAGLSLSSPNAALRRKTLDTFEYWLETAAQCGITHAAIVSDPDPGQSQREQSKQYLVEGLGELCELAAARSMAVCFEPLDRGAHKNGLLGPTADALEIMKQVRQDHSNIAFSLDTAHVALTGESFLDALDLACRYVGQIHFANAILDKRHPGFGDYHMPLGEPGFLTTQRIAEILQKICELWQSSTNKPFVSVETRTPENEDPWATERAGRHAIETAWKMVTQQTR